MIDDDNGVLFEGVLDELASLDLAGIGHVETDFRLLQQAMPRQNIQLLVELLREGAMVFHDFLDDDVRVLHVDFY